MISSRAGAPRIRRGARGGCASSRCAARNSAAAITTSSSTPAGRRCSRASSQPSITRRSCHAGRAPATRRSMPLLGGGLVPGTNTLLSGPSGVGKTTTAVRCMLAALERGESATYYLFDEGLGYAADPQRRARHGRATPTLRAARCSDPAGRSGRAVARRVRHRCAVDAVEQHGSTFLVIDSLNAYLQAMPGEQFLMLQMHELLSYPQPAGRHDDAYPRAARHPRRRAIRSRPQLPQRRRPVVPVLRGQGRAALGRGSRQEPGQRRTNAPSASSSWVRKACRLARHCVTSKGCSLVCRPTKARCRA